MSTAAELRRPALAFRVGVTGARDLPPAAIDALKGRVAAVLQLVAGEIGRLADDAAIRAVYAPGPPLLRLLSPLAVGADQLVADAGLAAGFRLEAPLPFPVEEYALDFEGDRAEFDRLRGRADRVLERDGRRDEARKESYRAVGLHVARNCDLLVALWDPTAEEHRGGTGDIVRRAAGFGVPIWWINLQNLDAPAVLLRGPGELRRPARAAQGEAAETALKAMLDAVVRPPAQRRHARKGPLGWIVSDLRGPAPEPLAAFQASTRPRYHWLWDIYGWFYAWIAPPKRGETARMREPDGEVEDWWNARYQDADDLSGAWGNRYRSTYVLISALAAVALVLAASALVLPEYGAAAMTGLELVAILAILALVVRNDMEGWHERWIACRLLAELYRMQRVLAPLGRSLPAWSPGVAEDPTRDAWVAWLFSAMLRASPMPQGALDTQSIDRAAEVGQSLFAEQRDYHSAREKRCHAAVEFLGGVGVWLFFGALVLVLGKLGLKGSGYSKDYHVLEVVLGLLATFLPAFSGVSIGIRAYAEFELLMSQSLRMRRVMDAALRDLAGIDLGRPLASEELGALLSRVTLAMLDEVQGWSLLFRTKLVEPG